MKVIIPDISKQVYKEETLSVIESKYSILGPMWVTHQMEWCNGIYASFKDHDKFLIIIFLIKKTLDFYSKGFIKLSYEEFYAKSAVEINSFSIAELSHELNIPKESTRRKVLELENVGAIKRYKKKIVIDRSKYYFSKPENSIKRISRFLSILSEMCVIESTLSKKMTSQELESVINYNFSYIWKIYYEMQIPMLISYKKIFEDLESFHIYGSCVVNQHLYAKKISENYMNKKNFVNLSLTTDKMQGINAMSISDITGIPRATVIRKLKNLVELKILTIDDKKHYRLKSDFTKKLMSTQKDVLNQLANFSSKIFNLAIIQRNQL